MTGISFTPSAEGTPLYSIHPYFTAELLLMLSTVIVWIVTLPIFLYSLVKGKIPKTRSTTQNAFIVSLALATIVAAISGGIFFSKAISYSPIENTRYDLRPPHGFRPPDPFARVYWLGILFCEGLWIAWTIFIDGPEILGKRARIAKDISLNEQIRLWNTVGYKRARVDWSLHRTYFVFLFLGSLFSKFCLACSFCPAFGGQHILRLLCEGFRGSCVCHSIGSHTVRCRRCGVVYHTLYL